ncbi:MAG: hypothetical protein RI573_17040 [Balneolaceae bacterium]|nr:hypothetical protein [Balneolaceae bacterium]
MVSLKFEHVGDGEDELAFPGYHIYQPDARVIRGLFIAVGIINPYITISGSYMLDTAPVCAQSPYTVRTNVINRATERVHLAGIHIVHAANKLFILTIIPDHLRLRAQQPLEHRPLLPIPCFSLT